MSNVIRLGVVVAALAAVVASAGGPKQHRVQSSMTVAEPREHAWAALLEVFARRHWAVKSMHERSGLLTTDWIDLGSDDAERSADCGKAPIKSNLRTQVKFEIRVNATRGGTAINVDASFRRLPSANAAEVACTSRGFMETSIHNEVATLANERTQQIERPPTGTPTGPSGFFCASSVATPTVSICTRAETDCDQARGVLAGTTTDLETCAAVPSAWCYTAGGELRCSATHLACATQREAAGPDTEPCAELR